MRAAYVTLYDAQDLRAWSGLGLNIVQQRGTGGSRLRLYRFPAVEWPPAMNTIPARCRLKREARLDWFVLF
jgi:hypothetical protein